MFEFDQTLVSNIVEGDSSEVCVQLSSGVITQPLSVELTPQPLEFPGPRAQCKLDIVQTYYSIVGTIGEMYIILCRAANLLFAIFNLAIKI